MNPAAIPLLEKYPEKIDWELLSENPAAIHLIESNLNNTKITRKWTVTNPTEFLSNPAEFLSVDNAIETEEDVVSWDGLSQNPAAIHLLEQHPYKINWYWLSANPSAIHLLEQHQENIDWELLSEKPRHLHLRLCSHEGDQEGYQ
jgi:membrane-bound lytic murein transglycosylase MltF